MRLKSFDSLFETDEYMSEFEFYIVLSYNGQKKDARIIVFGIFDEMHFKCRILEGYTVSFTQKYAYV